jgi:hypothetical protein
MQLSDETLAMAFMAIAEGGTCGFDATYSPTERRVTAFRFHGDA